MRGIPSTPRRDRNKQKQKENEVEVAEVEDLNGKLYLQFSTFNNLMADDIDVTLVETEESFVSTSVWPAISSKHPLSPSRRDANPPDSPSSSSALMNSALKAAASVLETREYCIVWIHNMLLIPQRRQGQSDTIPAGQELPQTQVRVCR